MTGRSLSEAEGVKRSSTARAMASSFTELGAKVFIAADAARVVAIVACYPGEGATYVTRALAELSGGGGGLERLPGNR